MLEDVLVDLNVGLLWLKLHSTRRGIFLLAHWGEEASEVMRISRQPSPVTIMIDQKQLENVECFKYLGSMLTNDVHVKLNPGLPWQKMHSARRRFFLPANWT